MRTMLAAVVITMGSTSIATSQDKIPTLPEIVIGGGASAGDDTEPCVDVRAGEHSTYNCLNQSLRKRSDEVVRVPNIAPVDAHSPDVKRGVVNMPAVRQQYGKNFGNSVIPYRPPPPKY